MLNGSWFESHRSVVVQAGIIVLACAVLYGALWLSGRVLIDRSSQRAERLRDVVFRSLHSPLLALIVVCGIYLLGMLIDAQARIGVLAQVLNPALHVGIIGMIAWAGWNLLKTYPQIHRPHRHELDPMIYDLAGKFARLILLTIAALLILKTLHFPIASLLTVGGVAGIAIGFAAQGVVSNLFGALVIYLDKPFKIGEWIVLPEINISGTVEHIGWRSTRIRGFDTSPYYVPNYVFNSHVVETPPRMQARRIQQTVPVRYADAERLPQILRQLREYIDQHPGIDHTQSRMVNFTGYGTHSLDLLIYCFASTVQWGESLDIQEDVLLGAARIIRENGGQLALPITRVQIQAGEPEAPLAEHNAGS